MSSRFICTIAIFVSAYDVSAAAEFAVDRVTASAETNSRTVVNGRVTVVDGRALWFPKEKMLVRLSGTDARLKIRPVSKLCSAVERD